MSYVTNKKAPSACNTKGLTTNSSNHNFAIESTYSKAVTSQVAKFALNGHAVYPLADGGFLVSRFDYLHRAPDFESLKVFTKRLGVNI
jgi:hypothetical protein